MLDVFFTVDVEIWCDGWNDIDEKFPDAFRRYVYGQTRHGQYGLPHKLDVLDSHGLTGVFFVEPLFSTRFGIEPLAEVVGLLNDGKQEVQLHLHTEWVDESVQPLLGDVASKRQYLRNFNLEEQITLIGAGAKLLHEAGSPPVNAFRAGSFGFNKDTLTALAANGMSFDSSYNASMFGLDSGVLPGAVAVEPVVCEDVFEYPMTVFHDGTGGLRHAQLAACSFRELEGLLWNSLAAERNAFVILSHNFELLNPKKDRADWVMVKRFEKLCRFLDRNRDCFNVRGFDGLSPRVVSEQPEPLSSPRWKTIERLLEQSYRRIYQ